MVIQVHRVPTEWCHDKGRWSVVIREISVRDYGQGGATGRFRPADWSHGLPAWRTCKDWGDGCDVRPAAQHLRATEEVGRADIRRHDAGVGRLPGAVGAGQEEVLYDEGAPCVNPGELTIKNHDSCTKDHEFCTKQWWICMKSGRRGREDQGEGERIYSILIYSILIYQSRGMYITLILHICLDEGSGLQRRRYGICHQAQHKRTVRVQREVGEVVRDTKLYIISDSEFPVFDTEFPVFKSKIHDFWHRYELLFAFNTDLNTMEAKAQYLNEMQDLFDLTVSNYKEISKARRSIELLKVRLFIQQWWIVYLKWWFLHFKWWILHSKWWIEGMLGHGRYGYPHLWGLQKYTLGSDLK